MNGGLLKSASRLALFAAAGLFVGGVAMPSAKAADLGGDCCADLEERVAELEATTARKGNRKMSLTITGQVDRMVMWWDDGRMSKTYYGLDNTNSSSRFSLLGEARVSPSIKMGFEIMIEIEAGGTSSKVNQFDEDGKVGAQIAGSAAPAGSFNNITVDSYFGDARRVAWWIEHKDIGRLTVGRYEGAGAVNTIDLAGIAVFAASNFSTVNGGFYVRTSNGATGFTPIRWADIVEPAQMASQRTELVRYDTPSLMGFIGSASIAEAGDYWGVMLRYAGEFSGVRIAAGVGYEKVHDRLTLATLDPTTPPFQGPEPDLATWSAALSLMHVPTGLFVQGWYGKTNFENGVNSGYYNQSATSAGALAPARADATVWLVQGGVSKNWFGWGNTMIYGEYGKNQNWGVDVGGRNFAGTTSTASCTAGSAAGTSNPTCASAIANFDTVNGVVGADVRVWGLGIGQNIDAAASTVYLAYRNFDADISCTGATTAAGTCAGAAGGAIKKLPTEQTNVVIGGAVVRF
jgi:hypothetical protein